MRVSMELLPISRFSLLGAIATIVHITVVMGVELHGKMSTLAVHFLGYLAAFSISFAGHYLYTFKSSRQWRRALLVFLTVSLALLALSSVVLKLCAAAGLTPMTSLLIAAVSIPILSYVLNKKLVF